jgi:hypothetical protein
MSASFRPLSLVGGIGIAGLEGRGDNMDIRGESLISFFRVRVHAVIWGFTY